MLNRIRAWRTGLIDGLEQPHDLTMGMSYNDDRRNESYDAGVNVGQAIGRALVKFRRVSP